ncbi:MAG: hypothetical protein GY822_12770 [Deltaproteobacteria bacterium]|nr:hypothetical protein [Deltaproteobacteria bacterium]
MDSPPAANGSIATVHHTEACENSAASVEHLLQHGPTHPWLLRVLEIFEDGFPSLLPIFFFNKLGIHRLASASI